MEKKKKEAVYPLGHHSKRRPPAIKKYSP